jgi:DNA-binding SARP family transcriptional activator
MDAELRFQLLGPVRAWRAGQEVSVGARKQRAVLAALLLNVGQPVSAEDVVAFVWGEQAPPAAAGAVHTYVRGLRATLDPGRPAWSRAGVVSSSSRGYHLHIRPDQIDCLRFCRLVRDGRRYWTAGRVDEAVDAMEAALALWAGRPLSDLGERFTMHPAVMSLEQQWLAAGVLAADAALATGRIEAAIPLLVRVTARAPLHEPLQARLIEAYRRVGRRADALATFDRVRRGLRDELGIGPGSELRAVFHRVLDDDHRTAPRLSVIG